MNVIKLLRAHRTAVLPMIVFIDMQREYTSENRRKFIACADPAIKNCASLLSQSRELKLPIAHFRKILPGYDFNRASEYSLWIDEVRPRPNEFVYEHSLPSCFSNRAFDELLRNVDLPDIIIAGLGAELSCVATIVEGYQRGYQMTYVHDCSASGAAGTLSQLETQVAVRNVLSSFGEVVGFNEIRSYLESRVARQVGN